VISILLITDEIIIVEEENFKDESNLNLAGRHIELLDIDKKLFGLLY
jgi:hypothetical protein